MASKVMEGKVCPPSLGKSLPIVRTLTGRDQWDSTSLGSVTIPLSVLRMFVCVSPLFPAWLPSSAFADVGPKLLVSYWYQSYGAQFLC